MQLGEEDKKTQDKYNVFRIIFSKSTLITS